ncbi:MAG: proline dehydrogenase family protein [Candidatus Marinimicrobia bacterium]|nr:proline dehydrogenase family protein [Candidatus Neomarinimicrobiota bacterium]MDP6610905.1 proline dehydrogenase family protein [Candidatus Neomarinimicrobiota bacterium]
MPWFNSSIAAIIPYFPKWMVKPFAKPYVAGIADDEALQIVQQLNKKGYAVTLDILGEYVNSQEEAENIRNAYSGLIQKIAAGGLNSTISVKLTHLGLALDPQLGENNILTLARDGRDNDVGITIDMENSPFTSLTFDIYKKALAIHHRMGTVIQAYLYRSLEDIKALDSPFLNLRICKGIYKEPPEIAIQDRRTINDNFVEMARSLLNGSGYACLATHDLTLIDRLEALIEAEHIPSDRFEFQVLYGVPMGNRLEELKAKGYTVRVYVPFGEAWFEYSVRRLKENPQIISYVMGNWFKK